MLLQSLIEYAQWDPKFTGALLFLDFEKAFDSIEWPWIFKTLTARGLPPSFITLIKLIYDNPRASVIVNGFRSHSFTVGRGVRQGCPLSPLLFALVIEPLLDAIRHNPKFAGIRIPYTEIFAKISCFADDSTACPSSLQDFSVLYQILDTFADASGLRLNKSKVLGLWLSQSAKPPPLFSNLCTWVSQGVVERVLGFRLGIKVTPLEQHQHCIDKIRSRLQLFSARTFSLNARVSVLKMCIHSILWYFAFVTPTTTEMIKQLDTWCYNFLWKKPFVPLTFDKSMPGRVNRARISLPREAGGLNFQSISVQLTALRTKWVKLFLDDHHLAKWKEVVLSRIYAAASPWLPRTPSIILTNFTNFSLLPEYFVPVIKHIATLLPARALPYSPSDILSAPLFFNPAFPTLLGDKTTPISSLRKWADIGITSVGSLFDEHAHAYPLSYFLPRLSASTNSLVLSRYRQQHQRILSAIPTSVLPTITLAKLQLPTRPPNPAAAYHVYLSTDSAVKIINLSSAIIRQALLAPFLSRYMSSHTSPWFTVFPHSSSIDWTPIWSSTSAKALSFSHQQFLWLVAHSALFVHASTKAKALAAKHNASPPCCPHCFCIDETVPHALFDCPALSVYWLWVYTFASHFLRLLPPFLDFRRHILLGDFMFHNVPLGIHYNTWIILRASSLHAVWKVRCSAAYDSDFKGPVNAHLLFSTFKAQLAFYANAHFVASDYNPNVTSDFHNMWVPGFFCTYRDHALRIVASPPDFKYIPQPVCLCPPPLLVAPPSYEDSDFLALPPHPTRCLHCGAPPPFYPVQKPL